MLDEEEAFLWVYVLVESMYTRSSEKYLLACDDIWLASCCHQLLTGHLKWAEDKVIRLSFSCDVKLSCSRHDRRDCGSHLLVLMLMMSTLCKSECSNCGWRHSTVS